ncbi:uncharacterized protein BJ212DRAFT_1476753 [Suillus subaureus]|uniref:Uncharacterized protein n=1 Tax=Suillus subaureus TaxID=48587 RepID=A0A9P7ELD6_9AGAM|nr:uncharacterized protein BJ212DRAFT_1476753 [Suillus subaureus]KAG1823900.1 hypothetical protein BJ212DRAFT_1476753 [Suillus subaureus]
MTTTANTDSDDQSSLGAFLACDWLMSANTYVSDAVLQLLSSLMLSHDDVQILIQVISDGSSSSPAKSSAAVMTPTATIITPAVITPVTACVQTAPTPAMHSVTIITSLVTPCVQTVPTPTMHLGYLSFPHLPMTVVIVNGEARGQQKYHDFSFDVPHAEALSPFYLVTCGHWCTSLHVLGVSCMSFSCSKSLEDSLICMLKSIDLGEVQLLP